MKSALLLFLMIPLAIPVHAQRPRAGEAQDEPVKTDRPAQQGDIPKLRGVAEVPANPPSGQLPSLLSRSDILSFNGMTTLIPKRAILHQPKPLAPRVNNFQQGSRVVGWLDFMQSNRGWITTVEVTRDQAEGRQPMDEKVVESYLKSTNLVVATFRGGPVSVLPLAVPEAAPPDASAPPIPEKKP